MSAKHAALAVLACAALLFLIVRGTSKVPEPTAARAVKPAKRAAKAAPVDAPPIATPAWPRGPEQAAPVAVAGPPPDPPDQPLRVLPDDEGGQTAESDRIWRDEKSTALDIDRANMLDVCACHDPECVRSLQTSYYARKQRAPVGSPNPEQEDAVRQSRTDCLLAISRAAYEQKVLTAR